MYLSYLHKVVTATVERLRRKENTGPKARFSEGSGRQLAKVANATAPEVRVEATGVAFREKPEKEYCWK